MSERRPFEPDSAADEAVCVTRGHPSADVASPGASAIWFIYMVRTRSGSLYTGISTDPDRRLTQHQRGTGARALRGKGPLILAWRQEVGERGAALRLEYRLKQQNKAIKEQLILHPDHWHALSQQWLLTSPSAARREDKHEPDAALTPDGLPS